MRYPPSVVNAMDDPLTKRFIASIDDDTKDGDMDHHFPYGTIKSLLKRLKKSKDSGDSSIDDDAATKNKLGIVQAGTIKVPKIIIEMSQGDEDPSDELVQSELRVTEAILVAFEAVFVRTGVLVGTIFQSLFPTIVTKPQGKTDVHKYWIRSTQGWEHSIMGALLFGFYICRKTDVCYYRSCELIIYRGTPQLLAHATPTSHHVPVPESQMALFDALSTALKARSSPDNEYHTLFSVSPGFSSSQPLSGSLTLQVGGHSYSFDVTLSSHQPSQSSSPPLQSTSTSITNWIVDLDDNMQILPDIKKTMTSGVILSHCQSKYSVSILKKNIGSCVRIEYD